MTLPLITPIGSNFLKDWPAQNAVNCNTFDAAAGACLTNHPLGTYTPIWTASTTNPTLGTNPVQIGYYYLVFDMVYVYAEMRLGTGSTRGSGVYIMSLPFKAKSFVAGVGYNPVGNAQIYNPANIGWRQPILTTINSATLTTVSFNHRFDWSTTNKQITESIPWPFGDGDGIAWSARYQRNTA